LEFHRLRYRDQRRHIIAYLRAGDEVPQSAYFAPDSKQRKYLKHYLESKLPHSLLGHQKLHDGAKITRDRFGVPHIFAENENDLWFACGYVQAQDRLWQLDYRHRVATGRLAEAIGDEGLHGDIESRTIGFERAARLELAKIDERSAAVLESFSRGVNAWIDAAIDDLPVEFDVLDYEPIEWSPIASLAVLREFWWSLTGRLHQIVGPERVLRNLSPDLAAKVLTPEAAEYIVPDQSGTDGLLPEGGGDDGTGSNNWVVGPTRSATELPMLASDPHWPIHFPDLWYEQHLVASGIDCIGAAYAGVPPVIFGRTRHAAWARTNNNSSTRDLYHERLDPGDSDSYLEGDTSVPFEIIEERILVHGGETHRAEIQLTSRGPIVNQFIPPVDPNGDGPISLKWVGHHRIGDLESLLNLNSAHSAVEIKQTLSKWRLSIWNAIYADDTGEFGYQMSGTVPTRGRKTRGTRDASAVEDRWNGYIGTDLLPSLANPVRGWAGSANNTPGPPALLGEITGAYADGYRFRRIRDVLSAGERLTPDQVRGLQWDNLDPRAEELRDIVVKLLNSAGGTDRITAAEILTDWDLRFEGASAAPAVWTALWSRISSSIGDALLGQPAAELMGESVGAMARWLLLGQELQEDHGMNLEKVVEAAASGALAYLRQTLGAAPSDWGWDRAHTVKLVHPAATTDAMKQLFNLGPFLCPGGGGTVNNRRPVETPQGFENASGVSYRLFVDMSEPGRAWGSTLAGQSGQPGSLHYDDRVQETLRNEYHPLLMDREDIERESEQEFIAPADTPV
jgi:penicillin amidase